MVKQNLPN